MVYLLTEDRGSGKQFWEFICSEIFHNKISVLNWSSNPNCTKLMEYALNITDTANLYVVVLDSALSTIGEANEIAEFKSKLITKNMSNIQTLDFVCFEYCILSFTKFIDWIYEIDDEFKIKRSNEIKCRDDIVNNKLDESSCLKQFYSKHKKSCRTYEQLCAKLLYELTRNTGFEITKGQLGECWTVSCCNWSDKDETDVCGLSGKFLNSEVKATEIFMNTELHDAFKSIGIVI